MPAYFFRSEPGAAELRRLARGESGRVCQRVLMIANLLEGMEHEEAARLAGLSRSAAYERIVAIAARREALTRLAPCSYFCTCWKVRSSASASACWFMPKSRRRVRLAADLDINRVWHTGTAAVFRSWRGLFGTLPRLLRRCPSHPIPSCVFGDGGSQLSWFGCRSLKSRAGDAPAMRRWSSPRFGKTRTGAEWVRLQVNKQGTRRIALVAPTAADARDVMVEGESGILAISPDWDRPHYEPSKRRLTWPNGAMATTYSADEPERLRGPQHDAACAMK